MSVYRSTRNALAMFLMKLRLNVSQRVIAFLFDCKHQSTVSEAFKTVLDTLCGSFTDSHVGYRHQSREQFMANHMKMFFTKVLGLNEQQMVLLLDGTYLYSEVYFIMLKNLIIRMKRILYYETVMIEILQLQNTTQDVFTSQK